MDADLKKRWIEALRSGKYQQSRKVLRDSDGFCCLGVLCDLVAPTGWIRRDGRVAVDHMFDSDDMFEIDADNRKALGLGHLEHDELIAMNDDGKPFAEIADYIEKTL